LRRRPATGWPPLIGLERVAAWTGVRDEGSQIAIGACTRFSTIIADPLLATAAPLLQQAALTIGAPAIRNMATLGGNLCSASPAADSVPPLVLLNAEVELQSALGCRRMPLEHFIVAPGQTRLGEKEVLSRVLLPKEAPFTWQRFDKVGRRQSLAIAIASFAGMLQLDYAGRVERARFAWGSVGPTVMRVPAIEALLTGQKLMPELLRAAAGLARTALAPIDDLRASAAYRRALAGNLLLRFLGGPNA
jgi:xanthine dehydrogenase FAD-binding subunit